MARCRLVAAVALAWRAVEAAFPLTFRVSDAERRRKVDGARTRGRQAVSYGDFAFGPVWVSAGGTDKRTYARAARPILCWQSWRGKWVRPILARGRLLLGRRHADVVAAGSVGSAGAVGVEPCRVMAQRSRRGWHRVAARAAGSGARTISMMIMRPPQHGHGGRGSGWFGGKRRPRLAARPRAVGGHVRDEPCACCRRGGHSAGCGGTRAAGRGGGSGG